MKQSLLLLAILFTAGVWTSAASADATNLRPVAPSGTALQDVFDGLLVNGPGIDAVDDQIDAALFTNTASGGAVATFIVEMTSYDGSFAFGLYSATDPSNKAEVFNSSNLPGNQAIVSFMANGDIRVNFVTVASGFDRNFGFYMESYYDGLVIQGGGISDTIYTEDSLNGGNAGALVYQGDDESELALPGLAGGTFTDDELILAFEEGLRQGGDRDYADLVVMVESVQPVPAPGAAVLAMMGLGMVGRIRRRSRLAQVNNGREM